MKCPDCCGDQFEEWVCIQEGPHFGEHVLRCFVCGYEVEVKKP
jgi:hypothetical protein